MGLKQDVHFKQYTKHTKHIGRNTTLGSRSDQGLDIAGTIKAIKITIPKKVADDRDSKNPRRQGERVTRTGHGEKPILTSH